MAKPPTVAARHVKGLPDDAEVSVSQLLDGTFGTTVGFLLYRGSDSWQAITAAPSLTVISGVLTPNLRTAVISLPGVAATTGGGIATWQPPEGGPVILLRCIVNVTVVSTGAANLSVGTGSSATTSYTNLITASDVHTAVITLDSLTLQAVVPANQALLMPAANFVTFSGSGSTVGMVASALIEYWKP